MPNDTFDSFGNYGNPLRSSPRRRRASGFGFDAAVQQAAERYAANDIAAQNAEFARGVREQFPDLVAMAGKKRVAYDPVKIAREKARTDRADLESKSLRSARSKLSTIRSFHNQALKAFDQGEGAELSLVDDGTGNLVDAGALAGQIADLEKKAKERVGTIRGALTPGIEGGDPTPEAQAAAAKLEPLRQRQRLLLEKRQRLAEQAGAVEAKYRDINARYVGALSSELGLDFEQPMDLATAMRGFDSPAIENEPMTPVDLLRMHAQAKDLDETIAAGEGNLAPRIVQGLKQRRDALRTRFDADLALLPGELRQRVIDATRDPTLGEKAKAFAANVAEGAGTALVDTGEFIGRNALRATGKGDSDAARFVKEFSQEMRNVAASWGPDVPEEVRAKLEGNFWTGDVAKGLGSTLTFLTPGVVLGSLGKAAGLSSRAVGALVTSSVAATGGAGSGNALRREAEIGLKKQLDAGAITPEEYERGVNFAEGAGFLLGTSEALPVASFAKRIGGTAPGRSLIRGLVESLQKGGQKGAAEFLQKNGRTLMRRAADVMGETFEEAVQEYGQSIGENVIAQGRLGNTGWEEEGDLVGGDELRGAGVGGVSGFLFSLATNTLDGARRARRMKSLKESRASGEGVAGAQAEGSAPANLNTPTAAQVPLLDERKTLGDEAAAIETVPEATRTPAQKARYSEITKRLETIHDELNAEPQADDELAGELKRPRKPTPPAPAAPAAPVDEWQPFAPETRTLGIPRAEMPQVKAEARGALTNFLKARGIESTTEDVLPGTLKPTQAEYSTAKVEKAKQFTESDRAILVSQDGHVVDGHHQWLARLQDKPTEPIKVVRLNKPIREVLDTVKEFPSAQQATATDAPRKPKTPPARIDSPYHSAESRSARLDFKKAVEFAVESNDAPTLDALRDELVGGDFQYENQLADYIVGGPMMGAEGRAGKNMATMTSAELQKFYDRHRAGRREPAVEAMIIRRRSKEDSGAVETAKPADSDNLPPKATPSAPAPSPAPAPTAPVSIGRTPDVPGNAPAPAARNTPKAFVEKVTKAARVAPASKQAKFLVDFATRLNKAAPEAFAKMDVRVLNDADWDADEGLRRLTPDSTGAFNQSTNTLYIRESKAKPENIVRTIVHEAGHFAEAFYLGEEFTQGEWEKLTPAQREAAIQEYAPRPNRPIGEQQFDKDDKRARSEWVAMQFARVVRGDTEGMSAKMKAKLAKLLADIRELVNKWVGNGKLTTPELDAKIVEMLGYNEPATQSTPKAAVPPPPNPKPVSQFTKIGTNAAGEMIEEDEKGVRSIVSQGVRSYESVSLRPTRGGVEANIDEATRSDRFKPAAPKPAKKAAPKISDDAKQKLGDAFDGLLGSPADEMNLRLPTHLVDAKPPLFSLKEVARGNYEIDVPSWNIDGYVRRENGAWTLILWNSAVEDANEAYIDETTLGGSKVSSDAIGRALVAMDKIHGFSRKDLLGSPAEYPAQESIPEGKISRFIGAARALIASGIKTPDDMVRVVDDQIGAGARKYAEALWDAFGMVDKSLRGTHDWNAIFAALDAEGAKADNAPDESASASSGDQPARGEQQPGASDQSPQREEAGTSGARTESQLPAGGVDVGQGDGGRVSDQPDAGQPGSAGRGDGGQRPARPSGREVGNADAGAEGNASVSGGESDGQGGSRNAAPRPRSERPAAADLSEADRNHRIGADDVLIPGGDKSKARANLAALKLLRTLEKEDRNPTPEEKKILAQYVGWGGLPNVFNNAIAALRERKKSGYLYGSQETELANWEKDWGKLYDEAKSLMSPEEFAAAARSTLNAHYTSRDVIEPMWDIARRLGFTGGTVLETSAGIGHFLGLQPADLAEKTKWKAVELDSITGRMLRKLYPQAQVQVTGFESAKMPNHSVDMVIGNFPFAKDGPIDDRYPRLSLHNYFFARSVDVLKPGGIIMAITSNSTMDAGSSRAAREWLAERADLVGAIRLPNTAFKKNAGTEVTTDIVILRKRGGSGFSAGHNWLNTQTIPTYNNKGEVSVNEYFARKPEMMLGRMSLDGSMYRGDEPALLPTPGAVLSEQLKDATSRLPENVIGTKVGPAVAESQGAEGEQAIGKDGLVVVKDGAPYVIQSGVLVKPLWSKTGDKAKLAVSYVGLREHLKKFLAEMRTEGATDNEITTLRQELNRLYDAHIKKFGSLNERSHNFLEDDPELPLVQALEDIRTIVEDSMVKSGKNAGQKRSVFKKVFDKATIFARRTIFPRSEPTTADTLVDGIQQSLAYRNSIDTEYIAKLRNTTVEDIEAQLHAADDVFHDPKTGIFETTDAYLSGFVRVKLANAQRAAQDDARYQKNVTALEKAQPRWLGMDEISFRLGSSWLPTNLISDFIADKLRVTAKVDYVEQTGHWILTPRSSLDSTENKTTFGSIDDKGNGLRATDIVDALLNLKSPVVFDEIETAEGKKRVRNDQQTLIAQQKAQELQRAFREWVQAKDGTHAELEKIYNDRFNGVVLRKFKGPTWEHYPNASQEIKLREHQKNVVWRILQESTLLAHSVGTGKTFIMITAAMEMRRLGLAKKPMIVTQNATTMQFAASFKKLYPTARILVPSEKQRKAENRKRLMSQIATGDYDAIIIPQSFLDQLPDDPERLSAFINQEISELEDARASAAHDAGKNSPRVKDLEKAKKRLEERLKALMDRKVDDTITFEQLGVDALFVDEAHAYKKLEFQTQMENIKGLDRGASERGLGLYMKTRWIQEKNNGKNVVLATGTPVSNTIAEAWNMLRFTRPDLLEAYGVERFDDFASTFGDTVTNIEQTAGGTFKQVTRFAKYTNGPELIALFHSAADVVLKDDVNLPNLPALKNGQPTTIMVKKSPELASYIELLRSYLASFEAMSGREKRDNSHIPLVVFGLAKKATLDLRLIDSSLPDDPGSKLNRVVQEVLRVHRESADAKGTQLVFADLFQNPDGKFNLYEEIRDKLVAAGIPREQVAIISEAKNAAQRERIFEAVKAGEIRVMLGSTEKMGVGVNVQERLIALHHMDAPARPMDIEQRNGRIIRQGNTNPVVEVFNYGVENTLDATLYQRLAIKQKFINQIMRGDIEGRSFEDAADEVSMTFEEQMAAFSGNPLAMKKVAVEGELRRLEALKSGHDRQQISVREDIGRTRIKLEDRNRFLPKLEQSVKEMIPTIEAEATGVIGGTSYDNRKALIEALDKLIAERKGAAEKVVGAEGFKSDNIEAPGGTFAVFGQQVEAVLRGNLVHFDTVDDDGKPKLEERWEFGFSYRSILPTGVMVEGRFTTGQGFLTSFASQIQNLKYRLEALKSEVAGMQRNLTEAEGFVGQPFAQAADLERLRNEAAEIEKELQAGGADTSGATPPREVHGVKPGDTFTFAPEVTAADETLAGDWMLIGIGMKKNGEQLAPVVKVRSVATNRIIDQLPEKEMRSASIVKRGLLSAPKSQTAPDDGVSASRASAAPEIGADPLQGFRMKPSKVNPERNVVGTLHGARWWSDGRAIYKGERPEKFEVTRPQAEASTGLAHYIPTPKATERQLRILGLERTANSDRLWMSNGMSVDPTYFLIARTIDPAVQPFASPGKLEAITFANPDTKEIVGIAMMNSLNIPTPDFVKSQMDGQTLGTPPESAGEDTTAPTLDPGKNAKVPGQDGYRYRSFPDSMILAGIETARQIYKTRGNKADDATAKDIINEIGEARAAEIAMDRASDLPGALKSAITVNLLHTLNKRRFDNTLTAAQRRAAQVMADRIAQVRAEQFTDMGQEIQFLSRLGDYDEDGVLQAARRGARQRQEKMVGDGGVQATKEITQEMKDANEKAIDEATADLEAALRKIRVGKPIWKRYQEMAARRWMKRIDAALNGAPEMPPMMEFTQRLIREVQNKIDAVLPQQDRPAPKTPAEIIREAVENRSKYAEAWDAAREAIGEQYADQPDVLEKLDDALAGLLDQPFSDKTIDRAIREAHQQMGITVRDLARMHYKQVDALGRTLAQKLVEDAGLRQEDAELVAKRVQERMADVTRDAKKRALARLAAGRTGVAKRMLSSADRIIEFSNLGAFSEAEYFDMLADILKLPKLTEEKAEKLRLLAARAQEAPEGFQRDRVMTDILTELQKIRGIGTVDIATAIYYMHILSGYTTQAVNGVSTALNTAADVTVLVARNPSTAGEAIRGLRDGAKNGFQQALAIISTGYAHRHFDEKLPEVAPVIEALSKDADRNAALRNYSKLLRYIGRGMKAVDAVFFYSASEAFQRVAAAKLAAEFEGGRLSWQERAAKVRELLSMSPADFEQARQKAKAEGLTGIDYQLRVGEILRQKRDPSLTQGGTDFGREATFNNEPRGYLGVAARSIRDASVKFPALRLFVPFTNIVSNVSNASLNYSPIGTLRAFRGYGGEQAPQAAERDTLLIKSIAGTLGMLYLLAYGMGDDDEAPWITGQGPKDNGARNQLRETGWKPHTVKIGGVYVSYLETPLAIPFAIVGNYIDAVKYNGMAEKDAAARLGKAIAGVPETIVSMSFLRGLADFMDAARGRKNWGDVAGSVVAGITVPNLVRQVDRTFDPTIYETDGALGMLGGQIPGVRQTFPEKLNVVGKPVEVQPMERFGRAEIDDPLWNVLAEKQAWIPEASKTTKLGNERMTPEQYRAYVQQSGPAIEQRLRAAVPALRAMTAEQADKFVQKVVREERERAKSRVRRPFVNPFPS